MLSESAIDDVIHPAECENTYCIIHKIIFINFKSYSGEQEVGPFDKSFTAVVGPNGSGKSNIIDGLLFVFGFRSSKLRQPKATDLIHNSEKFPNLPFCTVKIIFRSLASSAHEWIIERSVYRDSGRSEYRLNNAPLPYAEMVRILKESLKIDLQHNRWLILQGEVESIALMKPCSSSSTSKEEGLLEYLEEIIGSSSFIPEIEKNEKMWNETSTRANLLKGKYQSAELELNSMQTAVDHAQKQLNQFNELQFRRALMLKETLVHLEGSMKRCDTQFFQLQENHNTFKSQLLQKKTQLEQTRRNRQRQENEQEAARESVLRGKSRQEEVELQASKLKDRYAHAKNASNQLKKKQTSLIEKKKQAETLLKSIQEIPSKLAQLDILLQEKKALLPKNFNIDGNRLPSLRSQRNTLIKSLEDIESRQIKEKKIQTELQAIAKELESLFSLEKSLQHELDTLSSSQPELSKLVSRNEQRILALAADLKNYHSTEPSPLEFIRSMKGVLGKLGELLSTSEKHTVAFERATGPLLDYWVVETSADGQCCMDELRRRRLGRATFIVLDELNDPPTSPRLPFPEAIRLFDVITPRSPELSTVAYFAVRETLLAQNLEIGTKIAFGNAQRYRVVTFNGELIEPSGAMSGGGSLHRRKKKSPPPSASVQNKREELALLEKEREESRSLLVEASQRASTISNVDLPKVRDQIASFCSRERVLRSQASGIADILKSVSCEDMVKNLKKIDEEISSFSGSSVEPTLLAEIFELEDQIGELISTQKNSTALAALQVTEEALNGIGAEVELSLQTEKSLEKMCLEAEQELKDLRDFLRQTQKTLVLISKKDEEKLESEIASLEESVESTSQSLALLSSDMNELSKKEMDLRSNLSSIWVVDHDDPTTRRSIRQEELNASTLEKIDETILVQLERQANTLWQSSFSGVLATWLQRRQAVEEARAAADEALIAKEASWDALERVKNARLDMFMTGFREISDALKSIYQLITLGGNAELELVDSLDPFSEGVLFSVMPPKKAWKNISQLSGGEKTLSSLALIFALHSYRPTPFYVMDEIDAALDFRNVSIIANFIKERTKNAQFIVVSLRNSMFEAAKSLIGVYKTNNCTRSLAVDLRTLAI